MNYNLLFSRKIQFSLDDLKGYGEHMETFIAQSIKRFEEESNGDRLEKLRYSNPEQYEWVVDDLAERWQEIQFIYPNHFRYAFFSQIYSALEDKLKSLVNRHKHRYGPVFKIEKNLDYITKSKRYLELAGLDLSDLESDFLFIDSLRHIRNHITHDSGYITSSARHWEQVYTFVQENNGYLHFDHDTREIMENDKELWDSKRNFKFKLIFSGPALNTDFLAMVRSVFVKIGNKKFF